ncbi:MAG: transketolase [Bacteroidota bacterium]|nr:transketolase [Bacteroidota bacterium]MDE2833345.1 transketolase [Bacteroidota bacterium]
MSSIDVRLEADCINTIRLLAVDAVEAARSGHPGMPMGAAPMAFTLWTRFLRHNPADPTWFNRDRFVLSAGHGSMLVYALLHLTGYDLPLDEIRSFRQWGSRTPGHPEYRLTPGVETTTGPLGQGFANGVGMAIAEKHLAARFNREGFPIVDHYTYGLVSDGDLMEGISHEAASLAGHLGLGKLIYLWDDNHITIDGRAELAWSEDVPARFAAYDWHVIASVDGTDTGAIADALAEAKAEAGRPTLLCVRTTIGHGSPGKADSAAAHGAPLGADEAALTKQNLGWARDASFVVPDKVRAFMDAAPSGRKAHARWSALWVEYAEAHPDAASELNALLSGVLPNDWADVPGWIAEGASMATRAASGRVLGGLLDSVPGLMGGSADLTGSNKTRGGAQTDMQADHALGTYLRFGVREHAMAAICNGVALHGGLRPYCGTFLVFSDYMRPALRLSAIMELPVIYVFTHDSIGTGEDGPTHQGIEHLMSLRAMPNLLVFRPADANETCRAWHVAIQRHEGPTALILSRQGLPAVTGTVEGAEKGGYVLVREEGAACELILIGTGSELQYAMEAAAMLRAEGIGVRVVSLPSWELFAAQPLAYRTSVLPDECRARVVIEAGVSQGWERHVGLEGGIIGIDRFGASAPGGVLFEKFGFSAARVVEEARRVLADCA